MPLVENTVYTSTIILWRLHTLGNVLLLIININIVISQTFSRVTLICSVVSMLPKVDLTENTEVE